MSKEMMVRAWKDPAYRASLTPEERAALPSHPAGSSFTELDDSELAGVAGGRPISDRFGGGWGRGCFPEPYDC